MRYSVAETALRDANIKFERRFRAVEAGLAAAGKAPAEATLQEMDALWDAEKLREKASRIVLKSIENMF